MGKHNTLIGTELINLKIEFEAFKNYAPNKAFKADSQRSAFWVSFSFSVYGAMA
ncbi:hypothetical protein XM79_c11545 [Vibrio vulnificus]|nr:hypothetical protein XM79_c11545 [Vibrio vulnificus]